MIARTPDVIVCRVAIDNLNLQEKSFYMIKDYIECNYYIKCTIIIIRAD